MHGKRSESGPEVLTRARRGRCRDDRFAPETEAVVGSTALAGGSLYLVFALARVETHLPKAFFLFALVP
jgi:hypothetical protein